MKHFLRGNSPHSALEVYWRHKEGADNDEEEGEEESLKVKRKSKSCENCHGKARLEKRKETALGPKVPKSHFDVNWKVLPPRSFLPAQEKRFSHIEKRGAKIMPLSRR